MKKHPQSARRDSSLSIAAVAIAMVALTACGSDKEGPSKDTGSTPPRATSTAGAVAPAATSAAAAVTNAPAATTEPAAAKPGPNGRSAVPTMEEWTAAKEIGVKGSTKLGCETKAVREWLRVSCRGKNDTGGEPKAVSMTKGGGKGDTFTFAANKVTSLVCPFVDGIDIGATFEWTDKKQELVVSWPHGAPKPSLYGEFR